MSLTKNTHTCTGQAHTYTLTHTNMGTEKHTNTHVQDRHTLIHMEKHTHTHPHIQALMNVLFSEG